MATPDQPAERPARRRQRRTASSNKSPSAAAASGAPKPSSTSSKGVESAVSGYSGGRVENPTYEQVCTGRTGHAEVVQVTYDPTVITFAELLEVFWKTHDPTTLNRQGADVGTQYRSAIFYHTDEQQPRSRALQAEAQRSRRRSAPRSSPRSRSSKSSTRPRTITRSTTPPIPSRATAGW